MPHWDSVLRSAENYTYFLAVVALKGSIYVLSQEKMCYRNIGQIPRTMLKLRRLDRSCTPTRLIEESETSVEGKIDTTGRFCAAYCEDEIHFLVSYYDFDGLSNLASLTYSTVTRMWSPPSSSGISHGERWGAACQIGREIVFYGYYVNELNGNDIEKVYSLDLHAKKWRLLNSRTVHAGVETMYIDVVQWKNNFVVVSSMRLRRNERNPTYVWKVSLFNTTTCEWFMHPSSGTPPSSLSLFNAAAHENKLLVFGVNQCTFYPTSAVYSFDLELYSWSIVACDDLPSGSPMVGVRCISVNHLIYHFSTDNLLGFRNIMIHVLNMQSKSLTEQCTAKVRSNALELCRLPSVFINASHSNINK